MNWSWLCVAWLKEAPESREVDTESLSGRIGLAGPPKPFLL
jgi:hypothetical protein